MDVKLQRLTVYKAYGTGQGYKATAEFAGDWGKTELTLGPELGAKIVKLCLAEIAAAVQEVAANATASMLAALPPINPQINLQLEAPAGEGEAIL